MHTNATVCSSSAIHTVFFFQGILSSGAVSCLASTYLHTYRCALILRRSARSSSGCSRRTLHTHATSTGLCSRISEGGYAGLCKGQGCMWWPAAWLQQSSLMTLKTMPELHATLSDPSSNMGVCKNHGTNNKTHRPHTASCMLSTLTASTCTHQTGAQAHNTTSRSHGSERRGSSPPSLTTRPAYINTNKAMAPLPSRHHRPSNTCSSCRFSPRPDSSCTSPTPLASHPHVSASAHTTHRRARGVLVRSRNQRQVRARGASRAGCLCAGAGELSSWALPNVAIVRQAHGAIPHALSLSSNTRALKHAPIHRLPPVTHACPPPLCAC